AVGTNGWRGQLSRSEVAGAATDPGAHKNGLPSVAIVLVHIVETVMVLWHERTARHEGNEAAICADGGIATIRAGRAIAAHARKRRRPGAQVAHQHDGTLVDVTGD